VPDYNRVYAAFIEDRRGREAGLVAFDRHHVVPRCLGGGNEPSNIIRLGYGDHLFAHVVLARIHGGVLVQSAIRMSGMRKYNGGRRSRGRYDHLRSILREQMLGNKRGAGVRHTDEFKRELSERSKGKRYSAGAKRSPEFRARLRERMRGNQINLGKRRPHSPETIEKIRMKARARRVSHV
jgi:hypothetical protein